MSISSALIFWKVCVFLHIQELWKCKFPFCYKPLWLLLGRLHSFENFPADTSPTSNPLPPFPLTISAKYPTTNVIVLQVAMTQFKFMLLIDHRKSLLNAIYQVKLFSISPFFLQIGLCPGNFLAIL